MEESTLDFLPEEYVARKAQRRINTLCAASFLIATLAIASAFAISDHTLRDIETEHAAVMQQFNFAASRAAHLARLQQAQRDMASQAELTAALVEKVPRSYVIAEVTNAIPPGVSLLDLSMEARPRTSSPASDGAAANADTVIRLIGVGQTDVQVAQFVNKLSRSLVLKDVRVTDKADGGAPLSTGRRFAVEMSLDNSSTLPATTDMEQTRTTAIELKAD